MTTPYTYSVRRLTPDRARYERITPDLPAETITRLTTPGCYQVMHILPDGQRRLSDPTFSLGPGAVGEIRPTRVAYGKSRDPIWGDYKIALLTPQERQDWYAPGNRGAFVGLYVAPGDEVRELIAPCVWVQGGPAHYYRQTRPNWVKVCSDWRLAFPDIGNPCNPTSEAD